MSFYIAEFAPENRPVKMKGFFAIAIESQVRIDLFHTSDFVQTKVCRRKNLCIDVW
jgi:hypothetical protein